MTEIPVEGLQFLSPGEAEGRLLVLTEPLSFWGGFDPKDGRILDHRHPQSGESIKGRVLALPGSRGSAGTPAGLAEALRGGVGPVAILLPKIDVNLTVGADVARELYDIRMAVVVLSQSDYARLQTGAAATLTAQGLQYRSARGAAP